MMILGIFFVVIAWAMGLLEWFQALVLVLGLYLIHRFLPLPAPAAAGPGGAAAPRGPSLFQQVMGVVLAPVVSIAGFQIINQVFPNSQEMTWYYTNIIIGVALLMITRLILGGGAGTKVWAGILLTVGLLVFVGSLYADHINSVHRIIMVIRQNGNVYYGPQREVPIIISAGDFVKVEARGTVAWPGPLSVPVGGLSSPADYINDRPYGHIVPLVRVVNARVDVHELQNILVEAGEGTKRIIVSGTVPAEISGELDFEFNVNQTPGVGRLPDHGKVRIKVEINPINSAAVTRVDQATQRTMLIGGGVEAELKGWGQKSQPVNFLRLAGRVKDQDAKIKSAPGVIYDTHLDNGQVLGMDDPFPEIVEDTRQPGWHGIAWFEGGPAGEKLVIMFVDKKADKGGTP